MKFAAIILDGIDVNVLYELDMPFIQSLYEENGQILGCTSKPVTYHSNPLIWGGIKNNNNHWIKNIKGQNLHHAQFWDESTGTIGSEAEFTERSDYAESFIWDDLKAAGYDARALEIPFVMPPYSYNVENCLENCWMPANEEQMEAHAKRMPKLIEENIVNGAEFMAASIHMPDSWLHKINEGKTDRKWVLRQSRKFDKRIKRLHQTFENNNVEFAFFGDHGAPKPGLMKDGKFLSSRHGKESIIMSSLNAPTYTGDMYEWFLDLFEANEANGYVKPDRSPEKRKVGKGKITNKLEEMGYI